MERWAEAAGDQMEESLVMGRTGMYNESDPWSGTALLRMMRASNDGVLRMTDQTNPVA